MAYACKLGSSLGTSTTFSSGTSYSSVRFKCSVNLGTVSGYITFYGNHSHSSTVKNTITINNSSGTLSSPGSVSIYVSNFDTSKEHTFSITKTSTSYTVTLTADFEPITGTITYDKNGGTGGPSSGPATVGNYYTIPSSTPTKSGYDFAEWESDETGWTYDPGEKTLVYGSESDFPSWPSTPPILYNDTLIAQWDIKTYTISYNANGGSNPPNSQTKTHGVTLTLRSDKPTRGGYEFLGWATSPTATSATYSAGGSYTGNATATLYAVWKAKEYSVLYNGNGGVHSTTGEKTWEDTTNKFIFGKEYDISLETLGDKDFKYPGYNLLGWNTSWAAIEPLTTLKIEEDKQPELYAIWELGSNIRVYTNENWQIAIPYVYDGENWKLSISKVFNGEEWSQ